MNLKIESKRCEKNKCTNIKKYSIKSFSIIDQIESMLTKTNSIVRVCSFRLKKKQEIRIKRELLTVMCTSVAKTYERVCVYKTTSCRATKITHLHKFTKITRTVFFSFDFTFPSIFVSNEFS